MEPVTKALKKSDHVIVVWSSENQPSSDDMLVLQQALTPSVAELQLENMERILEDNAILKDRKHTFTVVLCGWPLALKCGPLNARLLSVLVECLSPGGRIFCRQVQQQDSTKQIDESRKNMILSGFVQFKQVSMTVVSTLSR